MNEIGIMQGRLLSPVNGQLQAFPGEDWAKEFPLARALGLDAIELIFDIDDAGHNPLNSEAGLEQITSIVEKHNVKVNSVCADYFMTNGFLRVTERERNENIEVLCQLTNRCEKIGVKNIVIPFVDQAEIRTDYELKQVEHSLLSILKQTDGCDVCYALEMSLPAQTIVTLMNEVSHSRLKVNYDTGNSTASGFDVVSEIELLHKWIVDIHIKDRKIAGASCLLGCGDTDFDGVFNALARHNYRDLLVLQTQRGTDEIETAKNHLQFVRDKVAQHYSRMDGNGQ